MTMIVITCPECQFSREVPGDKIPPSARLVNCPRCGEKFPLPPRPIAVVPVPPSDDQPTGDLPIGEAVAAPSAESSTAAVSAQPPTVPEEAAPPAPPVPTPDPAASKPRRVPFSFTGSARGYFGIWIVNALLKVVTLGLYSPWAKVRKRRYFFGHTLIDKANFDYLADPMALLRGMLLAVAIYFGYGLISNLIPIVGQILGLFVFLAIPWLIVRSRMFNSRYSSHRNIRFNFMPNYREAYIAYAGVPFLAFLCFFLAGVLAAILTPFSTVVAGIVAVVFVLGGMSISPYFIWRQKRFLVENARFGRTPFTFHAEAKGYYLIALKTLGVLLLVIALFGSAGMATTAGMATLAGPESFEPTSVVIFVVGYFVFIAAYLMVVLFWQVRVINLTWSSTRLGPHRLVSHLRTRDMLWIYLSSAVAIMCSFGLLIPWAAVRVARYRVSRTALVAHGDLDSFISAVTEEVDAAGEEIGDLFDVDIELGF